jgi:hypothetical protein
VCVSCSGGGGGCGGDGGGGLCLFGVLFGPGCCCCMISNVYGCSGSVVGARQSMQSALQCVVSVVGVACFGLLEKIVL